MMTFGPTGFRERVSEEMSGMSLRSCVDSRRFSPVTISSVVVVRIIVIRGDG
jgi:hypothetical protein